MAKPEHDDAFPAASLAIAAICVVTPGITVMSTLKLPFASDIPMPSGVPVQSVVGNITICVLASAVPRTLGAKLREGECGNVSTSVGAAGGFESSMYMSGIEHGDVLPDASVAVA